MTYEYRMTDFGLRLARLEVDDKGWRSNGAEYKDGAWVPSFTLDIIYNGAELTSAQRLKQGAAIAASDLSLATAP